MSAHSGLAADQYGRGEHAVVLLHPVCAARAIWHPQLAVWGGNFRLLAVDLPGHGASAPLGGAARLSDFARSLRATLDAAGIARASLVGVSLGAMVAQAFALEYPQRTRALVLANAGAATPEPVKALWDERLRDYDRLGPEQHVQGTLRRWFDEDFQRRAPLTVGWVEAMVRATQAAGYREAVGAIRGLDHRAALPGLAAPTLVIAGERDAAVKPEACAAMAEAIPQARFALLPGGHVSNVECAAQFTELAGSFLHRA